MRIGFIGAGNMAQAIFRGLLQNHLVEPDNLYVSDVLPDLLTRLREELGVQIAKDNQTLVQSVELVILAVKPVYADAVLLDVAPVFAHQSLISIVSGFTTERLAALLPPGTPVIRVMPNTPALVGEGATLLCAEHSLSDATFARMERMFRSIGRTYLLEERLFDIGTAVSGCGPAFFFAIQEAIADAGVLHGLPRALAYQLTAQTMQGAGKMLAETGNHPGALKDAVCSPGGTTIQGIYAFEQSAGRAACMNAVHRAYEATVHQRDAEDRQKSKA